MTIRLTISMSQARATSSAGSERLCWEVSQKPLAEPQYSIEVHAGCPPLPLGDVAEGRPYPFGASQPCVRSHSAQRCGQDDTGLSDGRKP